MKIEHHGEMPPYEQVRVHYASAISNRELPVGAKLPTVRALAKDLGLAENPGAPATRHLAYVALAAPRGRGGPVVPPHGDNNRERIRAAAAQYATMSAELGLSSHEALEIVRAALRP